MKFGYLISIILISFCLIEIKADWWKPTPGHSWDYQLGGENLNRNVEIFVLDGEDASSSSISKLHDAGKKVICYYSAGSVENWRSDFSRFPSSIIGKNYDGWPGEKYLDIRATTILQPIFEDRMKSSVNKKCDGIEWDNVDVWTTSTGFPLTAADSIKFLTFLSNLTHTYDLSVGLKNNADQATQVQPMFDFAIVEECGRYKECSSYSSFYNNNKPVFAVEYNNCNGIISQVEGIVRNLDLTPNGKFQQCKNYTTSSPSPSTFPPAEPTTTKPTSATAQPTTAKPSTAQPTTLKPSTAQPTTAKPTTPQPTTAKPTTPQPTTTKPTTQKPTTPSPTTPKPTTPKPTTPKPTTVKPTQPTRPTTVKPTRKFPSKESSSSSDDDHSRSRDRSRSRDNDSRNRSRNNSRNQSQQQ